MLQADVTFLAWLTNLAIFGKLELYWAIADKSQFGFYSIVVQFVAFKVLFAVPFDNKAFNYGISVATATSHSVAYGPVGVTGVTGLVSDFFVDFLVAMTGESTSATKKMKTN
jgi:hypothetical protein